mmetsp:Transcript_19113/g.60012  ORF Transcript_19113/g.60012 Transcript_19113/m.60012 type:complete len:279 (+) Transcript_19113:1060-1896(+)
MAHLCIQVCLLRGAEELHGLDNVPEVPALDVPEVAPLRRARREDHCVVLLAEPTEAHIAAHLGVVLELDALLLQQLQAAQDLLGLVQLHGGDAVHQEAPAAVRALDDAHQVARAVELLRRGQARGPRAHDGHAAAGALLRGLRPDPALGEAVLDDGQLRRLDRHGLLVDAQDAGLLAGRGAGRARELWEVVGVQEALQGPLPLALMYELVPSGDAVPQRAAAPTLVRRVARGRAAVHAAGGLRLHPVVPLLGLFGLRRVDLLPVERAVLLVTAGEGLA